MIDYSEFNDYELISLAREHNEEAINILYQKYRPLMLKKSRKIYPFLQNKGVELSDLIQECTIGFEEAIKNFDEKDNVIFYTFANVCMDRQLMSEVKKLNRNKYKFLNEALPLETLEDENDNSNLIDFIKNETANPESNLLNNEAYQSLYQKILTKLTPLENKVLTLKLDNYTYKEISKQLNITEKSIDNTMQRIRIKVDKILNS